MSILRALAGLVFLTVFLSGNVVLAETSFGVRVPTAYIATTGTGQSDEGLPPDPYETFSYDLALQEAGIENFNVIYYTSVLPPESYEIPLADAKKYFHHGAVLESIMAKAGGVKGDTVAAGVGRIWARDPATGKKIGGFAAEYKFIYPGQNVSPEKAEQDAKKQLSKSLQHELTIRNLEQVGEITFNITTIHIEKKYGIALAQLGFLNFIYLDPIPIDNKMK
ncbi:MAG: pyruvoyl-dependent arginine decarboxylase [Proteobacteria bacterium]|nr:pyruvoyl-dependent arginine decarboxylase [Pseudomonadota bacterium]